MIILYNLFARKVLRVAIFPADMRTGICGPYAIMNATRSEALYSNDDGVRRLPLLPVSV